MSKQVFSGRYAADAPDGVVVFLIGMRINTWWKVHRWLPSFAAMVPMLKEVIQQQDNGFLGYHVWFGRTTIVLQYWESMDQLMTYARAAESEHLPGWKAFNRRTGNDPDTGVWHEAYVSHPAETHVIYRNMPAFGLGRATSMVERHGAGRTPRSRPGAEAHPHLPADAYTGAEPAASPGVAAPPAPRSGSDPVPESVPESVTESVTESRRATS